MRIKGKVLGAYLRHIVSLLSKDFIGLVLIAVVIATPISWYAMARWLEGFAYRMEIQAWIFVAVGIHCAADCGIHDQLPVYQIGGDESGFVVEE